MHPTPPKFHKYYENVKLALLGIRTHIRMVENLLNSVIIEGNHHSGGMLGWHTSDHLLLVQVSVEPATDSQYPGCLPTDHPIWSRSGEDRDLVTQNCFALCGSEISQNVKGS